MTKKTTPTKASKSPKTASPAKKRIKAVAEEVAPESTPSPQLPAIEPVVDAAVTDATVANENAPAGPQTPAPEFEAGPVKAPKAPKEPKIRKSSGLDAAVQVLQEKGEPMSCKDIVDQMLAKGLWKTGGKTPAATIYSAILREIDGKPGDSRFVKTGRGLFGLTNAKA